MRRRAPLWNKPVGVSIHAARAGSDSRSKRVLGRLREIPKLTFQVIRRTVATLSQNHGTPKETQGLLRHARLPTTTDLYMQVIPEGVKKMVDSLHQELRKPGAASTQQSAISLRPNRSRRSAPRKIDTKRKGASKNRLQ